MKILIIEDDDNKSEQISQYINNRNDCELVIKKSYLSGIKEIFNGNHDLILLDMSMPTYDITPTEPGGRFRLFGGEDILREMKRKKIDGKAIVITQYDSFGDGEITLEELDERLYKQFPLIYLGLVYYNASISNWSDNLNKLINTNF
ncbi:response regulator [Clostridium saccharoperbutylacetonicum]